ncbi:MAG TPA: sugar phosphate isomerase/epimerase [Clostridiaceae bacterium]|nr:sugar phosphate isomerase/epimerase [Clostridiaceae bacterium]
MNKDSIAAQLYTLRNYMKTPEDIKKSLERVKKIGYNAVQVSGIGPIEPERLKDITDELGLKICATHTPFERFKNDLSAVIKEHKLWGCEYVGIGSMPREYERNAAGFTKFAKEFSEIGRRLADNGLHFIYHDHKFEFEKFDGTIGLEILLNESDPDAFGFEIDTYWVQAGGANPVDWINKVKGRMKVVHLKDFAIVDDKQVFAEIGQGNLNWPEILKACRETGVKWYAVEQDTSFRNPFDSLDMSFKYLEKLV